MKTIIRTILVAIAVFLAASCHQYSPIDELASIADELEQNSSSYSADDWQGIIEQYESVVSTMEGYEFTNEERQEIGRQQGRCLAQLTKGYAKIAAVKGSSFLNQLKGVVEGFQEEFGDGSDVANEFLNALDGLFE